MSEPLTHARIGYDTITDRGTVVASSEATGFPAVAAQNSLTYSAWKAAVPSTWEVDLPEVEACNYFGMAAHDVWSSHCMAVMQAWIDGAWATLPVLTTIGDVWDFDSDCYGVRGASLGSTVASRRRGVAVDGGSIVDVFLSGLPTESKYGTHAFTAERATDNILHENARTAGDTGMDLSGFLGSSDCAPSADRAVSGTVSMLVTPPGADASVSTAFADVTPAAQDYTGQLKVWVDEEATVTIGIEAFEGGDLGSDEVDVYAGQWNRIQVTKAAGVGDSGIRLNFTSPVVCYIDELQVETGSVANTWVNGTRATGFPEYPPEIIQQIGGDCTINFWARCRYPTVINRSFFQLSAADPADGNLQVRLESSGNTIQLLSGNSSGATVVSGGTFTYAWSMVTVVVSVADTTVSLYVDGVLVGSDASAYIADWRDVSTFRMGWGVYSAAYERIGYDGKGLMDNVSIVNYAASGVEILGWFSGDVPVTARTLGIPAHQDDRPIMALVEETTAAKFRVRIVGEGAPTVGVIYMGKALEMTRPLYGGHSPISLSRTTVIRPNASERGQWLGRSIIRSGAHGSWAWANLKASWVREYLDPFIEAARTSPFFILWRPETFPGEAGYCWTTGDVAPPSNAGTKDFMSFALDAEGLGSE